MKFLNKYEIEHAGNYIYWRPDWVKGSPVYVTGHQANFDVYFDKNTYPTLLRDVPEDAIFIRLHSSNIFPEL
jgi:hypothetical protein